jgi:L-lactate dehydrogenase complex protein LldF
MHVNSPNFKSNVTHALADTRLQKALSDTRLAFPSRRAAAVANLPEFEQLRDIGRDIKNHTLANLDFYLETYAANVERAGGTVHWCSTADEARAAVSCRMIRPAVSRKTRFCALANRCRILADRSVRSSIFPG